MNDKSKIIKKCSNKEHLENDAIMYCPDCKIYMCNKCTKIHSSFISNHHQYNLDDGIKEIFTGYCKEESHKNIQLKYYCKSHNQLICAACITKIEGDGDGQHKNCEVCSIQKIKEEKKNKLIENIKCLEELENKFNESLKELKEIFDKIEKDKEELKLEIQNIFTKIRNAINEREEELLLDTDNLFKDKFINDDTIHKAEKLPKRIKLSLEKGKLINEEWDRNKLTSYINDCINLENNIKIINKINENIIQCKKNGNIKIKFYSKEDSLNNFIDLIKKFGNIVFQKYSFRECPTNTSESRKYIITGDNKNIITKIGPTGIMGTICEKELDKSILMNINGKLKF